MAADGAPALDQVASRDLTPAEEDQEDGGVLLDPNQNCPLMRLPAELRNRIYEYAVLEPGEIFVQPGLTRPPALLATCTTIRKEAIGIWINRNTFYFQIVFSDARFFIAWERCFHRYRKQNFVRNVRALFGGQVHWCNIRAGCKALFQMGMKHHPIQLPQEPAGTMFIAAVNITCDGVKHGHTWDEVGRLLYYTFRALKAARCIGLTY